MTSTQRLLSEQVTRLVGSALSCLPVADALEIADAQPLLTEIFLTEEVPFEQALAFFRAAKLQRELLGLTPIIVGASACGFERLREWSTHRGQGDLAATMAAFKSESAESFLGERASRRAARAAAGHTELGAAFETALDGMAKLCGGDPMAVLHRVPLGDFVLIEDDLYRGVEAADPDQDEPYDFASQLLPDDLREAHAFGVSEREAFLTKRDAFVADAGAFGQMGLVQPIRSYDEATAMAELGGSTSRVALVASTPALALLHLGFGGFNECPSPHQHALVWGHWRRTVGAEPVIVENDRLIGTIARPVDSRTLLVRFAREVALYDADALDEGFLPLLGALYRNSRVGFWWD